MSIPTSLFIVKPGFKVPPVLGIVYSLSPNKTILPFSLKHNESDKSGNPASIPDNFLPINALLLSSIAILSALTPDELCLLNAKLSALISNALSLTPSFLKPYRYCKLKSEITA